MTFEQYLDRFMGVREHVELVRGVTIERMAAQFEHERLFGWLYPLMVQLAEDDDLGIVLGSRSAVKIDQFGGRLPDILFIRKENLGLIQEKAIFGAPDLVIEIRSPGDRPHHIIELEADYRSIGVPEIWFLDIKRKQARVLLKSNGYRETIIQSGVLESQTMAGLRLPVEWLFQEPRPKIREALAKMRDLVGG